MKDDIQNTENRKRNIYLTVLVHAVLILTILTAFTYSVIQQGPGA